jgi:uncharacterized iron-regulated protein
MADYIYTNGQLYSTDELTHYGIPGMRWGVRRAEKRSARIERKGRKKGWSDDAIDVSKIRAKKVKQMSNAELKKLNERNQLEVTNRDLKHKQNRGKRTVDKFVKTAGTIAAVAGAAAIYKKYGTAILSKIGTLTPTIYL